MRKQQHEQRERPERIDRRIAAHAVRQVGDELERKEADADGQDEMGARQRNSDKRFARTDQEIEILEGRERGEVEDDAEDEKAVASGGPLQAREQPGGADLADQQRDEPRIPPAVEDERGRDQYALARHGRTGDKVVADDRGRQEQQNELLRLKQHAWPRARESRIVRSMPSTASGEAVELRFGQDMVDAAVDQRF